MKKLKKIFQSTIAKVISISLILIFALSVFLFFDFYKRQIEKVQGYYWVHQGDKAFKKQDLHNAINHYEKGIKLHPKHYRAMYNLANLYVVYEDYYNALKNYEKAQDFFECTSLTSVTLPSSLKEVDCHLFRMCTNLKQIYI